MIVNNLKSNIREFITVFGGVTQEQIHLMFREHNPSTINYHLQGLIFEHNVILDEKNRYIMNRSSTIDSRAQERLAQAAWLVAAFGSHNIISYYVTDYPIQVLFITKDNVAYDVTMIHISDAKLTTQFAKRVMEIGIAAGEEDQIKHIAFCTHKELVEVIAPYEVFDYVAVRSHLKGAIIKDIRTGVTLDVE